MRRYHQLLGTVAILAFSSVVACTHSNPPAEPPPIAENNGNSPVTPPPAPPAPPPFPKTSARTELSSTEMKDVNQAAEGMTAFAADLYAQMRNKEGNLFISPYSIGMALALTAAGSQGETYEQIQKVFRFPSRETLGQTYGNLAQAITVPPKDAKHTPELNTANSLWVQKDYPLRKDYLNLASTKLHAGIFEVDYVHDREGARRRVNAWVEKETRDRIRDLVPNDAVDSTTKIILANAIFFKAQWLEGFKKDNTVPSDFTLANGRKVKAPLMYQMEHHVLLENHKLQVLRLPYDGNTLSMYLILPRSTDKLADVEKELTASNLKELTTGNWGASEVKVWLPKFKFTIPTELTQTLQKMGIEDAFLDVKANFKGMTDDPNGLCISRVIHKAFVEVDEVGTEAAAATAVVMVPLSAPPPAFTPPPPKIFKADHPFLFVIKHEATGAILFLGRVEDPTK